MKRAISILILLTSLVGAVYYTAVDQEGQGAVVVLLGILYFVALPRL